MVAERKLAKFIARQAITRISLTIESMDMQCENCIQHSCSMYHAMNAESTVALFEANPIIGLTFGIVLISRHLEIFCSLDDILCNTVALFEANPIIGLTFGIVLISRHLEIFCSLDDVLRDTLAGFGDHRAFPAAMRSQKYAAQMKDSDLTPKYHLK
jgi:hypothetical protein